MFKLKLWQTWTRKMESGCFNSEVCLHLIPFTVCSRLLLKPHLHGNTIWWFMYNWDMNIHINRLTSASLPWNMRFFAGKWLHINTLNTSQENFVTCVNFTFVPFVLVPYGMFSFTVHLVQYKLYVHPWHIYTSYPLTVVSGRFSFLVRVDFDFWHDESNYQIGLPVASLIKLI